MVTIQETESKSVINRMTNNLFTVSVYSLRLSANPYKGCQFDCPYCYAPFINRFGNEATPEEFGTKIFSRVNAADILRSELEKFQRNKFQKEYVDLGTVTDAYQPAEAKYRITRKMLEVFLEYEFPVTVLTKSSLVLNDLDIWKKLAEKGIGCVGMTITMPSSKDLQIQMFLEPNATKTAARLSTLKKLVSNGVPTYVFVDPIVPFLSDNDEEMRTLVKEIANTGCKNIFCGVMKLSNLTWSLFRKRLNSFRPELVDKIRELYIEKGKKEFNRSWVPPDDYCEKIYAVIRDECIKQKLTFSCERFYHLWTGDCWDVEGAYAHPTGYNLWHIIKNSKGKLLTLDEFVSKLRNLDRVVKEEYLNVVRELWNDGKLFKESKNIVKEVNGGKIFYKYKNAK